MYKCENLFELSGKVDLPQCMYEMRPFFELNEDLSKSYYDDHTHMKINTVNLSKLEDINIRQQYSLKKLESIIAKIDPLIDKAANTQCCIEVLSDQKGEKLCHVIENLKGKLHDLGNIKNVTQNVSSRIVISANPSRPPYGVLLMIKSLQSRDIAVSLSCSAHSSILQVDPIPNKLFHENCTSSNEPIVEFRIHWKKEELANMKINASKKLAIIGESNILRYMSRLFPSDSSLNFEAGKSEGRIAETDYFLDLLQYQLILGSIQERHELIKFADARLSNNMWMSGKDLGITDILLASGLMQLYKIEDLPAHIQIWLDNFFSQKDYCACYAVLKSMK